jgi:hypothetical protein
MAKDINLWTKECIPCQTSKTCTHISPSPTPIPIFSHIHVDLVSPVPLYQGHTHILTITDCITCWAEATPFSSTSTTACADAILFWSSHSITSDRGSHLISSLWCNLSIFLNIPTSIPPPFILYLMASLNVFTDSSKAHSGHAAHPATGSCIYPGFSFSTIPLPMTSP